MTRLAWLELNDFRSFTTVEFRPVEEGLTLVTGENGTGKTSLLEGIGYLSTAKSFRGSPRESLIRTGTDRAFVRGEIVSAARTVLIEVEIRPPARDRVQLNRQPVTRLHELLEVLRVTIFSPDDLILIKGGPEERRNYLDDTLVAMAPKLAVARQSLDRVLRQRAMLLRQSGGRPTPEVLSTLDVWDAQLAVVGTEIVEAREALVVELAPVVAAAFERLTGISGTLHLSYRRSFDGELVDALAGARTEDLRRAVTTVGPHRDDLFVSLDDLDARTRLSQGRQRAATLALRLGAHHVVGESAGSPPLLLLDDAFSELDAPTAEALAIELPPGQAVLTTAGPYPAKVTPSAVQRLVNGRLE